jgi:hypothetical protein
MRTSISVLALKILIVLLCSVSVIAYASNGGSISGRVEDPSGKNIANAVVQLREINTNQA